MLYILAVTSWKEHFLWLRPHLGLLLRFELESRKRKDQGLTLFQYVNNLKAEEETGCYLGLKMDS